MKLLLKLEVVFWTLLLGGLTGCPITAKYGPAPMYGPGPMPDCTGYATTISEFLATPSSIQSGDSVTFTVEMSVGNDETVSAAQLQIAGPDGGAAGPDRAMHDDGDLGDAVADDGIYTAVVADGAGYPFDQTGQHDATATVTVQKSGEFNYCERSATTEVDVQ